MSEPAFYNSNLLRGFLLRNQRRYDEAAGFFGKAIEHDPEKAPAYAGLAACLNDAGRQTKALEAIDRAIAIEPMNAEFLGLKGWIFVCQGRYGRALEVANRAVEIDPVSIAGLNAQANAYTLLKNWKQAEVVTRKILALNANDAPALNLLAQSLRLQGRGRESREVVERILALLPNNAFGHMNAGYAALQVGDHLRANEHFLSSLRKDPHSDLARKGLLHSLRARVWIYRLHLRYAMFVREPASFLKIALIVGFIVGVLLIRSLLEWCHQGLGSFALLVFWVCLIYLNFFSRITGNIFLCFDPVGRHALTRRDKIVSALLALVLAAILGLSFYFQLWVFFVIILAFLGTFAFSILYPQALDRWRQRKQEP
jgi:tetratricopeptide (TPR) repeat protein